MLRRGRRRTATLTRAEQLGGTVIRAARKVSPTSFGGFADARGHRIGVAANG